MTHDEIFIDRTFELAALGKGFVSPNPMVGALIVRDDHVISEGWHAKFGDQHAEIRAINNATTDINGATLYVNLLPCCHMGKTGPCTDAIIKSGITKVVYSNNDPNPLVASKSLEILMNANIDVTGGILEERGYQLNKKYFKWMETGLPYFTAKIAMTLDGKLATNTYESKWITSDSAREFVHELRRGYDAILVGSNTVLHDNPNLGLHEAKGRDPLRIILTKNKSKFDIHKDLEVFRDENFVFINSIGELKDFCAEQSISSVLVEGGSETFTSFIKSGLLDDIYLFYGPLFIGDEHISAVSKLGLPTLADAYRYKISALSKFGDSFLVKLDK